MHVLEHVLRTREQHVVQLDIAVDDHGAMPVQIGQPLRDLDGPPQRIRVGVDGLCAHISTFM